MLVSQRTCYCSVNYGYGDSIRGSTCHVRDVTECAYLHQ